MVHPELGHDREISAGVIGFAGGLAVAEAAAPVTAAPIPEVLGLVGALVLAKVVFNFLNKHLGSN